ncbi:M56 family metallopeptidase [Maribellus sp. YY47]|uniref:M56 family metallopeptidase n=1 Tax=Maribellus sp. YY47 TaxID=2929486 RepID=UPI002001A3FE|nr:M56 family metallopeptidase [Maribellus sp. YY47]MCK3686063.1 M56 family metallopeptidase [Maribellus sp. YY47]
MNSAVNFLVESGVSLALLSLIYILFLRKETFFRLNRFFLLVSVAFSVLLPFLHFRVYEGQPILLAEVTVTPYKNLLEAVTIYGQDFSGTVVNTISSSRLIIFGYLLGLLFFTLRLGLKLAQVFALIRRNPVQASGRIKFVLLEKEMSPFSFLNYVFINPHRREDNDYKEVLAHEMEHIRQGHTFDVLILEVLTVLQWFNPFMWILKKVIRENHEFLADRAVLSSGVNAGRYKQLLLNQVLGLQPEVANHFNSSLIKKRIKMISGIKSSKLANIKYLAGAISIVALVTVFACENKETIEVESAAEKAASLQISVEDGKIKLLGDDVDIKKVEDILSAGNIRVSKDSLGNTYMWSEEAPNSIYARNEELDQVFLIVEDMPVFPGGENGLRKYIANSVKYPVLAQENGIQGKVYVTFVVGKDGFVKNARIARGVDPVLDKEALRVVNTLPQWKPGIQRGEPVNVSYTVPINFVLQ